MLGTLSVPIFFFVRTKCLFLEYLMSIEMLDLYIKLLICADIAISKFLKFG